MRHLLLLLVPSIAAAAQFAPVFTDYAVLQRDQPVAVWGNGRDGEKIEVEILGKITTTIVRNGQWSVTLPTMTSTDSTTLTLRGDNTVDLKNVAIGEVWLGLGQSNMEWRLNQCAPLTDQLLSTAGNPRIRQLKIPLRSYAGDALPTFGWKPFDKASAPFFGAVAYFFAAALQEKLGVTIGIVNCSYGGTTIQAWMSREAIAGAGQQVLLDEDLRKAAAYSDPAAYERSLLAYQEARRAREKRKETGASEEELGPELKEPYGYRSKTRPTGLRASMLSIIIPYTVRGALWYQGENNADNPDNYGPLLSALMAELRRDWDRHDLPVFIGQLSSPTKNWPDDEDPYARMRDIQLRTAKNDPCSGFVVTLDRGERHNVHPIDKKPVGERFADLAIGRVYGKVSGAGQSPSANRAVLRGGQLEVFFDDLPGRLELRDPSVPTLEIQRDSGVWQPATALLSPRERTLILPLADGVVPKAVRYAWRNFCTLTIFSDEDLPVAPWNLPVTSL